MPQDSAFNPETFLDATTDQPNEKRPALPVENPADPNGCYFATIGEIKTRSGTIGKGARLGEPWLQMVVQLRVDVPPQLREALGLPPQLTLTDGVFIDLLPGGKGIDNGKGRNRGQKAYRDATGLNTPGTPFAWRMLEGRTVKVKIAHEDYQGSIQERVQLVLPV